MAITTLWAGSSAPTQSSPWTVNSNRLPSPVSVEMTREQIWDENAGRNAKGNMIATYVNQKYTYNIKWGVIDSTDYTKITTLLKTGFFYFARNSTQSTPPTSASLYYRSEITSSIIQAGGGVYYADVSVSVIQK